MPRIPLAMTWLWPGRLWRMPGTERVIYLTFDDGPFPEVTDQVLELLGKFGAKATFFAVGQQAARHPELLREVESRGHVIGNHSHTHPNGHRTPSKIYRQDVETGGKVLEDLLGKPIRLFRPPYGRLRSRDARVLKDRFRLVMWDVLAGDWIREMPRERVRRNVLRWTRPGSVVVFHDSPKAAPHMLPVLEATLQHFSELGYRFEALPELIR